MRNASVKKMKSVTAGALVSLAGTVFFLVTGTTAAAQEGEAAAARAQANNPLASVPIARQGVERT